MKQLGMILSSLYLLTVVTCTEQHDPTQHHAQIQAERMMAQRVIPKLTEDGKVPSQQSGKTAVVLSAIDKKYQTFCASCHGMAGDANTPAGKALNPRPRNFTDAGWQGQVDDKRITKVIKEGGAAVGLSATMAAWGAMLSDEQIVEMVAKIRGFKK